MAAPTKSGLFRPIFGAAVMATLGALPVFMLTAQSVLVAEDVRISVGTFGLLVSLFYAVASLSSVPTGRLCERIPPARAVQLATGLTTVSLVGLAAFGSGAATIAAALVIGAVGTSMSQGAANSMLSMTTPPRHQGLGFGIKQSALPAASMLAGLVVPTLGVTHGWRWGFVLGAVIAASACVLVPRAAMQPAVDRTPAPSRLPFVPAKRRGPVVLFSIASFFGAIAMGSVMTFFVFWATESGISVRVAAGLLAVCSLGSMVLRILVGVRADRKGGKNMGLVIAAVLCGSVGALCIATGIPAMIAVGAVLTVTISWSWPGLMLLSVSRSSQTPVATISLLQTGAYGGNSLGPALFAAIIAASSYRVGWLVASGFLLMAAGAMAWGRALRIQERVAAEALLVAE